MALQLEWLLFIYWRNRSKDNLFFQLFLSMKTSQKDNYILISSTENSFAEFIKAFKLEKLDVAKNHTVLELSENLNTTLNNLSLFLDIATDYSANGMSFVVICNGIDIDEIPDELNVVPTLHEAEDVLEMEAIERDLGF
jgi:hypothetical protein